MNNNIEKSTLSANVEIEKAIKLIESSSLSEVDKNDIFERLNQGLIKPEDVAKEINTILQGINLDDEDGMARNIL